MGNQYVTSTEKNGTSAEKNVTSAEKVGTSAGKVCPKTETETEVETETIIAQSDQDHSEPPQEKPVFMISLIGDEEYPIYQSQLEGIS